MLLVFRVIFKTILWTFIMTISNMCKRIIKWPPQYQVLTVSYDFSYIYYYLGEKSQTYFLGK